LLFTALKFHTEQTEHRGAEASSEYFSEDRSCVHI